MPRLPNLTVSNQKTLDSGGPEVVVVQLKEGPLPSQHLHLPVGVVTLPSTPARLATPPGGMPRAHTARRPRKPSALDSPAPTEAASFPRRKHRRGMSLSSSLPAYNAVQSTAPSWWVLPPPVASAVTAAIIELDPRLVGPASPSGTGCDRSETRTGWIPRFLPPSSQALAAAFELSHPRRLPVQIPLATAPPPMNHMDPSGDWPSTYGSYGPLWRQAPHL